MYLGLTSTDLSARAGDLGVRSKYFGMVVGDLGMSTDVSSLGPNVYGLSLVLMDPCLAYMDLTWP